MTAETMRRVSTKPLRAFWIMPVLFVLTGVHTFATALEPSEAAHEQYRVLEWRDLVPADWEPPLVSPAYDKAADTMVDSAAVVTDLDGQLAALPGYMKPLVYEGNKVAEFLLVPYLPHQVTAHAHVEPNQMVYVVALEPVVIEQPFAPIWIVGALSVDPVMTDDGAAAYRMVDAVTTAYDY